MRGVSHEAEIREQHARACYALPSPVSRLPSPVSRLPSPVSRLPSPVSRLPSPDSMPGTVILSHGSDSGPDATKVSALAKIADELGWKSLRPDFREEDKLGHAASVQPRAEKLVAAARDAAKPLVLAGSSMGAFVSGLASLQVPCTGIFLIALPMAIPRWSQRFDMANVPAMLVHGFNDELCPVAAAVQLDR